MVAPDSVFSLATSTRYPRSDVLNSVARCAYYGTRKRAPTSQWIVLSIMVGPARRRVRVHADHAIHAPAGPAGHLPHTGCRYQS